MLQSILPVFSIRVRGFNLVIFFGILSSSGSQSCGKLDMMMERVVFLICFLFPHVTVWGSCFSLGSRRCRLRLALRRLLFITPSSLTRSLTDSLTHSRTHSLTQAQYRELPGCLSRGRRSTQSLLGVAGAVHRASWRSCGARGRRWGRGCLSRGRRSTQSLLGVAGAVHRASWRSCGARGRRWGRGCLSRGRRSTQSDLSSPLITDPLITSQLLITTHHNSSHLITYQVITAPLLTPHSSQLHCSSQLITAPLLTGPLLITTHQYLSQPNS